MDLRQWGCWGYCYEVKKEDNVYKTKEVGYYGLIAALERCFGYIGDKLGNSLVIDEGLIVVEGLGLFDNMMEYLS